MRPFATTQTNRGGRWEDASLSVEHNAGFVDDPMVCFSLLEV